MPPGTDFSDSLEVSRRLSPRLGTSAMALGKIGGPNDTIVAAVLRAWKDSKIPEVTALEALRNMGYVPGASHP